MRVAWRSVGRMIERVAGEQRHSLLKMICELIPALAAEEPIRELEALAVLVRQLRELLVGPRLREIVFGR